jgi:cytoskeletal protein RodZ
MLHSVCFRHLFSCGACTGSTREPADFSTDVKEPAVSIHPAASREQLADSGRVPDASPASSGTALANSVDQVAALVNSIRYHGRGLQQVQRQPLAEDRASSGASHVQAPSSLSSASKTATAANMMAEDLSVALMMACSVEIADDAGAHGKSHNM